MRILEAVASDAPRFGLLERPDLCMRDVAQTRRRSKIKYFWNTLSPMCPLLILLGFSLPVENGFLERPSRT